MLLSRVAESLYWINRYLERAENISRFVEVSEAMSLDCLLYTSPSPRDGLLSRMPSSA